MYAISFKTPGPPAGKAADQCSFCGKSRDQVRQMCAGPGSVEVHPLICDECATVAQTMIDADTYSVGPEHCTFCGKGIHGLRKVKGVIAGGHRPGVAICNECTGLVGEMFRS